MESGKISYFEKETFNNSKIGTHSLMPNLSSYRLSYQFIGETQCGETIDLKNYEVKKDDNHRIVLQGNASNSGARKLLIQAGSEDIQAAWIKGFQSHIDYCNSL